MDSIKEVFNKADILFQKENYSKSKDVYLSILDITKDKYDLIKCYTQLGECYFHENDFDNAKKYYEMSFELEPLADNILSWLKLLLWFYLAGVDIVSLNMNILNLSRKDIIFL